MSVDRKIYNRDEIMRLCSDVNGHALGGFIDEEARWKIHALTAILRQLVSDSDLQEITVAEYRIRIPRPRGN